MLNNTKIISICIIVFVLMASCTSIINPETEPNNASDQVSVALTSVSNVNYLDQCKTLNPLKFAEQAPYQNIWPGKTKASEVESILGIPQERSVFGGVTNLVYGDTEFFVSIENGVVTNIVVDPDTETRLSITLKEVILRYGCPDLVLAVNTTEDQVGYNSIRLIYSTLGMEVSFSHYPANLSDGADIISYFPSMTVQEYFEKNGWAKMPWSAQPIEWNDAVK